MAKSKKDEKNDQKNLVAITETLRQEGIEKGKQEAKVIIEDATAEAGQIHGDAVKTAEKIIADAKRNAQQIEQNGNKALRQASRDVLGALNASALKLLQNVFGKHCESLMSETEYMHAILAAVLSQIKGEKTVKVSPALLGSTQQYLLNSTFKEEVILEPLPQVGANIIITCSEENGMEYQVEAATISNMLFALLNPDLLSRITKEKED